MEKKLLESDWKTYNKLIPLVLDRYLQLNNQEVIAILSQKGETPTDNFWEAKRLMDKQAQILNKCLGYHSRSKMMISIILMHENGLIQDQDLDEFSEFLRQDILKCSKAPSSWVPQTTGAPPRPLS